MTRLNSPFTSISRYFNNGVLDSITNRQSLYTPNNDIAISLDPVQTPIIFNFISEVYGTGVKSEIYIDFTGNPSITQINIFGELFTESATGSLLNNEFYNNTFSIIERINSLVNAINYNVNVNQRYVAINDNNIMVRLIAKYEGTQYSLTAPNFSMTPNLTTGYIAGVDANRGMQLQNYNYKLQVEVQKVEDVEWLRYGYNNDPSIGSRNRQFVATLYQSWNETNQFTYDVSKYLNDLNVTPPLYSEKNGQDFFFNIERELIGTYYLIYGEEFIGGYDPNTNLPTDTDPQNITNTTKTKRRLGETELRWYSNGAYELANTNNNHPSYQSHFYSNPLNTITNTSRLIKQSTIFNELYRRRVDEPYYAYYYIYNDQSNQLSYGVRLRHEVTYIDGTFNVFYSNETLNLTENGLYKVCIDFTNLNLTTQEAPNRVYYYDTTLEINNTGLQSGYSEPKRTWIDLNNEREKKYTDLYWVNEFGTIDQFTFEGLKEEKLDTKGDLYTKSLLNDGNERYKHYNSFITKKSTRVFNLTSGWLNKQTAKDLRSILKSNQVWQKSSSLYNIYFNEILDLDETYFEAINITNQDQRVDNLNELFQLTIQIEVAIPENNTY